MTLFSTPPATGARVTVPQILEKKGASKKIVALTAYDFTTARLVDRAGIDMILVGDSLGCVIQGFETTIPVSLDEMIYHSRCVCRGVAHALVVGDLPFLSYQTSIHDAVISAGRLIKEAGVQAVKLEGGLPMAETIARITAVDIPVVGHVGLTPQSYHRMGGHKIQGKKNSAEAGLAAGTRDRVLADAKAVADAGAFAVVLEGIPANLAREITASIDIPTIGIGAGSECDGQIIVLHDLVGLEDRFQPKFVTRYANVGAEISLAVSAFAEDVRTGQFPIKSAASAKSELKLINKR